MEIKLYLRMIQRSWWIVALTALSAVLAALISAFMTTPIYSSSSRYIVSPNPNILGGDVDYNLIYSLDTLDKRTIITTYAEVLNSPRIYAEVAQALGLNDYDLVDYAYSATVFPETNIIEFTVQGPDPELAALLTARIGERAVDYVEGLYPIYEMGLLDPATVPTTPISPQPIRDAGVALVLGLALGVGLALVSELLRSPLVNFMQHRKVDEMSQALNRPAFEETLKDAALGSIDDFCLCFVHLEGLRDYMNVLPQSTLQNIFRHVNQVLKNQLRGNDLVGRWSDLDFSVLLAETPGQAAWNTMNRVQAALSIPIKIDVSGDDLDLKPVIGIAEYRVGDTLTSLTNNTNWALEVAKKNSGIYMLKATEVI
jgi:capsular polysaccharide biosynthesis protein